jgi:preprotein translocase subunit SecG
MATVLLVIHLMIAAALVGVVLLQRSEGGALGIGGGGGGFMTGRGAANLLTRATAVLAAIFFLTSFVLSMLAQHSVQRGSLLDQPASSQPATPGKAPATPSEQAPAPPSTPAPAAPSGPRVPQSQ